MKTRLSIIALILLTAFGFAIPADAPDSSLYTIIKGAFVIKGYDPDGDSVRFIADNIKDWDGLENAKYLKKQFLDTKSNQNQDDLNKKNSVQLRFEGIDTPEFGDGGSRQPFGLVARDFTLKYLGFSKIKFSKMGKRVQSAIPARIRGVLLCKSAIPGSNGRPIVYVFRASDWTDKTEKAISLSAVDLEKSLNLVLLQKGLAYPEFYNTMPTSHRSGFQNAIQEARSSKIGIWKLDQSRSFRINTIIAIREKGSLIMPKLYRRLDNYFEKIRTKKTNLSFLAFLKTAKGIENDRVRWQNQELKLSDLLEQNGTNLRFIANPSDVIFY